MAVCSMLTSWTFISAAGRQHVAVSHDDVLDVFEASVQHCACGSCIASTNVSCCICMSVTFNFYSILSTGVVWLSSDP